MPFDILDSFHIPLIDLIIIPWLCNNKSSLSDNFLQDILNNVLTNIFLQKLIGDLFEQRL